MKKSKVQIGKEFEAECYEHLKTIYKKVEWLSYAHWKSHGDFRCIDENGSELIIDAKKAGRRKVHSAIQKIITKEGGSFIFYDVTPEMRKDPRPLDVTAVQLNLTDELNTWLMHKTIELSHHDKRITIISLLYRLKESEGKNEASYIK